MSLFSFNIFTGISFCCEAFLELRFWISVKKFLSFFILKREFVTVFFHTLLDTDYTGMCRELVKSREKWIILSGFRKMCFVSLYI